MGFWDKVGGRDVSVQDTNDFSSTGDAAKDAVSNRNGGGYSQKDAKTETGATKSEMARSGHDYREADQKDNARGDRHKGGWFS